MEMRKKEIYRDSAGGEKVFSRCWLVENPRAIVQIAHGKAEHTGRYEEFAMALCNAGYSVYANDHLGHGNSMNGHRGAFSDQGDGFVFVQEDMLSLFDLAVEENGSLPLILIGHSMGSVLAGLFAEKWGQRLSALILLGTPVTHPFLGLGICVARYVIKKKGRYAGSRIIDKFMGTSEGLTGAALEEKKSWLTRDVEKVYESINDENCGYSFTVSGYLDFLLGMKEMGAKSWGKSIPDIPILIAGGGHDSAGGNGKRPRQCAAQLQAQGHTRVTLKIYPDDRHELHNELDRQEFFAHLLDWLQSSNIPLAPEMTASP